MAILTIRNSSCLEPQGGWVEYGLLYNWYAATDARDIAADGWSVPSQSDFILLRNYLDPSGNSITNISGKKLKSSGTIYWNDNLGINEVNFNGVGSGQRGGGYSGKKVWALFWTRDEINPPNSQNAATAGLSSDNDIFEVGDDLDGGWQSSKVYGYAIRLIKNSTTLSHGQTGTYVGNDGKVYQIICIGTQEWLSENLAETKCRNGDIIPEVTDNTAWVNLVTGALCSYENDWDNV